MRSSNYHQSRDKIRPLYGDIRSNAEVYNKWVGKVTVQRDDVNVFIEVTSCIISSIIEFSRHSS